MQADCYHTIKEGALGLYKEKGSKFISISQHIETEEEFKVFLEETKKKYYDARHHCYAWRLGPQDENYRSNDDGEPSGSAGKPILNQLLSKELFYSAVIVVRYFGGTKLGVSGLITAYKTSARESLNESTVIKKYIYSSLEITFDYPRLNNIMRIIKEEALIIKEQDFQLKCLLRIEIKKNDVDRVLSRLSLMHDIKIKQL